MKQMNSREQLFLLAHTFYRLKEIPGTENNPVIMGWARDLGINWYQGDETEMMKVGGVLNLMTIFTLKRIKMVEEFKIIQSNPNYEISNFGRVRNVLTQKILKPTLHVRAGRDDATVYLRIELKNPRKKYLVHRLVAEAFIPNPDNHQTINHKDEDGRNNHILNLEWCSNLYNCTYSQGKRIHQLNKLGEYINSFNSASEAARETGSDVRLISAVCLGKRMSHNNYQWRYEDN